MKEGNEIKDVKLNCACVREKFYAEHVEELLGAK